MYIKQDINVYQFRDMFTHVNRGDNFSYEGLGVLFEYLESYSEECLGGEPLELHIVALCCEFTEMSWQEVADSYDVDLSDCEDDEERVDAVRDYLEDNTSFCGEFTNDDGDGQESQNGTTFVFQAF